MPEKFIGLIAALKIDLCFYGIKTSPTLNGTDVAIQGAQQISRDVIARSFPKSIRIQKGMTETSRQEQFCLPKLRATLRMQATH
jgi:hypothetical protein